MSYPAKDIFNAYHACDPKDSLEKGDPRYVDLREVRSGRNLAQAIHRRIKATQHPKYHQHLITGHKGCGKSTELRQIKGDLQENGLFCVYLNIEKILDVHDLEYLDVLLEIARVVNERLREEEIELPDELLTRLDDWFADIVFTKQKRKEWEAALQSQFGVEATEVPLLRFLTAITGSIRRGGGQRVQMRKRIRSRQGGFLKRLNELLNKAQEKIKEEYEELVVIVDGLDKMPYELVGETGQSNHSIFFVHHAEALKKPNCHIIYTVPISLIFNEHLADAFPDYEVIPMVTPEDRGLEKLREIIQCRVSAGDVFESEDCVDRIIDICGGAVRDLLKVIRFACDETDDTIGEAEVNRAIQKLVREYDFLVEEKDIPTLKEVSEKGYLSGDETSARLLQDRLVLEYYDEVGQRYADVHPAVRKVDRVQQALES